MSTPTPVQKSKAEISKTINLHGLRTHKIAINKEKKNQKKKSSSNSKIHLT